MKSRSLGNKTITVILAEKTIGYFCTSNNFWNL